MVPPPPPPVCQTVSTFSTLIIFKMIRNVLFLITNKLITVTVINFRNLMREIFHCYKHNYA